MAYLSDPACGVSYMRSALGSTASLTFIIHVKWSLPSILWNSKDWERVLDIILISHQGMFPTFELFYFGARDEPTNDKVLNNISLHWE